MLLARLLKRYHKSKILTKAAHAQEYVQCPVAASAALSC